MGSGRRKLWEKKGGGGNNNILDQPYSSLKKKKGAGQMKGQIDPFHREEKMLKNKDPKEDSPEHP